MYASAIPLCNGKPKAEHMDCVARIRHEYSARFADRYSAQFTAASVETLLFQAVVLSYAMSEIAQVAGGESVGGKAAGRAVCATNQLSSQYAVSAAAFTIVPITCAP